MIALVSLRNIINKITYGYVRNITIINREILLQVICTLIEKYYY